MPGLPPRTKTFLAGAGLGIEVDSPGPALSDWLAEFWRPWLADTPATPPAAARLRIEIGPACLAQALHGAAATGERAHCFTFDNGGGDWATWASAEGEIALDETATVGLVVGGDSPRSIRLLADSDGPPVRQAALRAVREVVTAQALAHGAASLHAAAVASGGSVTLFVGPKGAGKTTHLISALASPGAQYVANDRVLLDTTAGSYHVRGMPTIVALRAAMLDLFPFLGAELESGAWHFASTVREGESARRAGRAAAGLPLRRPPGISPAQLCALLHRSPAAGGTVERIVFPRIEPAHGPGLSLRPLRRGEAASRLLAEGLVAGGRTASYLTGAAEPDLASLESLLEGLVRDTPCFEGVLGSAPAQAVA